MPEAKSVLCAMMFLAVSAALPETTSLGYTKNSAKGAAMAIISMANPAMRAALRSEMPVVLFVILISNHRGLSPINRTCVVRPHSRIQAGVDFNQVRRVSMLVTCFEGATLPLAISHSANVTSNTSIGIQM